MRPYSFSKPKIRRLRGLGCNMRIQIEYQSALPSSTEVHDPPIKRNQVAQTNYRGMIEMQGSARLVNGRKEGRMLKKAVQQGRRRVETGGVPSGVR